MQQFMNNSVTKGTKKYRCISYLVLNHEGSTIITERHIEHNFIQEMKIPLYSGQTGLKSRKHILKKCKIISLFIFSLQNCTIRQRKVFTLLH